MIHRMIRRLGMISASLFMGVLFSFPAFAETLDGKVDGADSSSVKGWVWDKEDYNHILSVELHITPADSSESVKVLTAKADDYREDLQTSIGDGYHGFSCDIDWNTLDGSRFILEAYSVSGEEKTLFADPVIYDKKEGTLTPFVAAIKDEAEAPEVPAKESPADTDSSVKSPDGPGAVNADVSGTSNSGKKGESLGIFTTTGYCSCTRCTNGSGTTYSGAIPQDKHTISADVNLFPIGTKLMIGDTIYTVEDVGSSVAGNKIDVYYSTHEAAYAHGIKQEEVFRVVE